MINNTLMMENIVEFLTFPFPTFAGPSFLIGFTYFYFTCQSGASIANFIRSQSVKTSETFNIDRSEAKQNLTFRLLCLFSLTLNRIWNAQMAEVQQEENFLHFILLRFCSNLYISRKLRNKIHTGCSYWSSIYAFT